MEFYDWHVYMCFLPCSWVSCMMWHAGNLGFMLHFSFFLEVPDSISFFGTLLWPQMAINHHQIPVPVDNYPPLVRSPFLARHIVFPSHKTCSFNMQRKLIKLQKEKKMGQFYFFLWKVEYVERDRAPINLWKYLPAFPDLALRVLQGRPRSLLPTFKVLTDPQDTLG